MRVSVATILAVLAAGTASGAEPRPTPGWPSCVERTAPVDVGLRETGRVRDERLVTLRLRSRALGMAQTVRVLLPRRYDSSGRTRYPVLYALHGAGGDPARTWLEGMELERLIGDRPLIVVLPQGSATDRSGRMRNGGYTDWFGLAPRDPGPAFAWESHHVRELVPYVDRTFPTRSGPAGRAVVGISMGAGGLRYAAKHPGLFGYAGSLSGAVAPNPRGRDCEHGDPALHPVVWRGDSAIDLAANLRGVRIWLRSGDGTPGPLDPPGPADSAQVARLSVERLAFVGHGLLVRALRAADVRDVDAQTFAGSHAAPYWRRELPEFLTWLDRNLRDPVRTPTRFRVDSARRAFTAWGWSFATRRRVREFLYADVNGSRLTLRGSGRVTVTTPPRHRPGRAVPVGVGPRRRRVVADARGRLRFRVDLGASHRHEQRDFGDGPGTGRARTASWRTAGVRIG